jgi:uncharacterized protein with PQ loop repeat
MNRKGLEMKNFGDTLDGWKANRKKILGEIGGYAGMVLLQGATLPQLVNGWMHPETANYAPLSMVLMVWIGLWLYLIRAIVQNDKLYMLSNGIGVVLNFVVMLCIIFGE